MNIDNIPARANLSEKGKARISASIESYESGVTEVSINVIKQGADSVGPESGRSLSSALSSSITLGNACVLVRRGPLPEERYDPDERGVTGFIPVEAEQFGEPDSIVEYYPGDLILVAGVVSKIVKGRNFSNRMPYMAKTFAQEILELAYYVQRSGQQDTTVICGVIDSRTASMLKKKLKKELRHKVHIQSMKKDPPSEEYLNQCREKLALTIEETRKPGKYYSKKVDRIKISPYIFYFRVSELFDG